MTRAAERGSGALWPPVACARCAATFRPGPRWPHGPQCADCVLGAVKVPPACRVPGCHRIAKARRLCNRHYLRWWKHGDPTVTHRPTRGPCQVPGCRRTRRARGLCGTHYERWRTTGDPRPGSPIRSAGLRSLDHTTATHPETHPRAEKAGNP